MLESQTTYRNSVGVLVPNSLSFRLTFLCEKEEDMVFSVFATTFVAMANIQPYLEGALP